ncbi:MAG TPA: 5-(carboxyamino)imidazole ribonucleotide mutase [Acidimicrobiales bacterium]|nr:5-(carboxyamino)imidazole ribonucleotide mutase [Acidimicrobiales bacterium]
MGQCSCVRHGDPGDLVQPVVGIVMGSSSDLEVMNDAATVLDRFKVGYERHVISAHRTPEAMLEYAKSARARGLQVLIAGAGGAAHLPGMLASVTTLPVIGVPVALARLDGLDSLLSIVQMPRGVPVATVAINGATNAGLLALRILASSNDALGDELESYRQELGARARAQDKDLSGN